jgi:hypothetical protein
MYPWKMWVKALPSCSRGTVTVSLSLFVSLHTNTHTHTHTYIYIYMYLFIYKFPLSKSKSPVSKISLHCMSPACPSMSVLWLDYIKKKGINNDSSTKLYACDRQKLYSLVLLRILAIASFWILCNIVSDGFRNSNKDPFCISLFPNPSYLSSPIQSSKNTRLSVQMTNIIHM